jgi:hypothetical protein
MLSFVSTNTRLVTTSALFAVFAIAAGCGDETETSVPAVVSGGPGPSVELPPMSSYSGPGSNWHYELNDDGSYEVTRSAAVGMPNDLVVSGTYQTTAAGFLNMTVDAATGIDAPATGSSLWALEVPDYALFLSPASTSDDSMIPMIQGGQCSGADLANNWISVQSRLSADVTSDAGSYFGTFEFTAAIGAPNLSTQFALTNGFPDQGAFELGNGFCNDGVLTTASSDIYMSGTGSVIANADAADEDGGFMVLALPKTTAGSISDFDGDYVGTMADSGADDNQKMLPVSVTCAAGICSGDVVTDVTSGSVAGQPFTVDLFGTLNAPTPGFATGQLTSGGVTGNVACMVDNDVRGTGQRMISCAGQSPSRSYRLTNLIIASTD